MHAASGQSRRRRTDARRAVLPRGTPGEGERQVAREDLVAPVAFGALGLIAWQGLATLLPDRVLPTPTAVASRFVLELREGGLLGFAGHTLTEAVLGSLLGLAVAVPLGYLVARSRLVASAIGPYLAASQAIPAVALAPLLVVWFGYGLLPTALLCALLVFFPIFVNTTLGLSTLDPDVIGAAKVDGAGRWRLLVHIEGPLALPALLAGIRNGFVLSVTGAVVGEFVMGGQGLGLLLSVYRDRSDVEGMFAVLVALVALAISVFYLIRSLERRIQWL
ncbi:ABC transporter permease [Ruania sp. N2-46]|uniref:ABC transporter permease n=1 Tax=Occultella gossypii TaxID=2800820 RepID=A0ABS7S673_9MICO|nr:ABC transporter permease [Occultella gossypii]